jgi:prevent-host-death family protein
VAESGELLAARALPRLPAGRLHGDPRTRQPSSVAIHHVQPLRSTGARFTATWQHPAASPLSGLRSPLEARAGSRHGSLPLRAVFLSVTVVVQCYRRCVAYPLNAAQMNLGELVAEVRQSRRPVTISENGKPVVALIDIDDLADLEDRAALAAHLTDKAAGRRGVGIDDLDAALDRIDAETPSA